MLLTASAHGSADFRARVAQSLKSAQRSSELPSNPIPLLHCCRTARAFTVRSVDKTVHQRQRATLLLHKGARHNPRLSKCALPADTAVLLRVLVLFPLSPLSASNHLSVGAPAVLRILRAAHPVAVVKGSCVGAQRRSCRRKIKWSHSDSRGTALSACTAVLLRVLVLFAQSPLSTSNRFSLCAPAVFRILRAAHPLAVVEAKRILTGCRRCHGSSILGIHLRPGS